MIFLTINGPNFVHCRVNSKGQSIERPMAYQYGSQPERSGGMISSRPKKCRYTIPVHTVSL